MAGPNPSRAARKRFLTEKKELHIQAKERIGKVGADCKPKDIVLLNSGTTTLQVVRHIPASLRNSSLMTLVTNSQPIAQEVLAWPSPKLTILGGLYLPDYQATVGPQTLLTAARTYCRQGIPGCGRPDFSGGATTADVLMAEVDRLMVERSRQVIRWPIAAKSAVLALCRSSR